VSKRRKARGSAGKSVVGESLWTRVIGHVEAHARLYTALLLLAILGVGLYIRLLPAIHYRLELDASDPWIEYWMAKEIYTHGLFDLSYLRNVKLFWYPEGRDFIVTARIGVPWLAAATYHIAKYFGLTLREWLSLIPPLAGALGVLLVYGFTYSLTRSRLAGLVAASLYSLTPGAIVRTTAGFVEKIGIAFPFIVLFLWLWLAASRASRPKYKALLAFLAGLTAGSISFLWGGYAIALSLLVLEALVEPFIENPRWSRLMLLYIPASLGAYVMVALNPSMGPLYITRFFGLLVIAPPIVYGVALVIEKMVGAYNPKLHLWLILSLALLAGALVASGYGGLGARVLAAIGIRHLSPLVESVQEHMPASWGMIFREYGVALVLALVGLIVEPFMLRRKAVNPSEGALRISLYIAAFLLFYANKNLSYFTEMAASFNSLAAGILVGSVMLGGAPSHSKAKKKRGVQSTLHGDQLRALMALSIILLVTVGVAVSLEEAYVTNSHKAPAIMTSMLGALSIRKGNKTEIVAPINGAWINALDFIRENTSPNALVISWWDYGYWITVNTNRTTVADGATLNETQIRILARLLTSTEDGASALLREYFHAVPNNTYIVFYDVFYGIYNNGTMRVLPIPDVRRANETNVFIVHGSGDLPKSFQMLKIGYRIYPFAQTPFGTAYSTTVYRGGVAYHHFPGFVGGPDANRERVYNTLLYRLTVNGLYELNKGFNAYITDDGCRVILERLNNTHPLVIPSVLETEMTASTLTPVHLHRFQLVTMSIGCPLKAAEISGVNARVLMVIVFIYKWTG
jgi:dolichyl-diphosphooligosaccharide--protein glycosyltransferase